MSTWRPLPSLFLATFCWPNPLSTFSFLSSASCAHPPQEGLWWTEDSCSGEASLLGLLIKDEACYTQKYLRGLGDLWWSAAYYNFWTQFRVAYNRVNTVSKLWSCGKLLRNLPAFCFHSSATIKTCKRIYYLFFIVIGHKDGRKKNLLQ